MNYSEYMRKQSQTQPKFVGGKTGAVDASLNTFRIETNASVNSRSNGNGNPDNSSCSKSAASMKNTDCKKNMDISKSLLHSCGCIPSTQSRWLECGNYIAPPPLPKGKQNPCSC